MITDDIVLLPFLFGADLLMRASAVLVLHIMHIQILISSMPIIYMAFFIFFNSGLGLVGLWLFLNLHRASSTTPTLLYSYRTKNISSDCNTLYTIKKLLLFPVKYLGCQTQPQCSLWKWSLPEGMLTVHKSGLCFPRHLPEPC